MKKNKKNKALGIGLEALIPKYQTDNQEEQYIDHISISKIIPNKNQPRQIFVEDGMNELVESIQENGILQPLSVRKIEDGKYELIAGERRLRAAKKIKLKTVPVYAIKVDSDEQMLKLALIENIQRQDLSSMEEAEAYALLRGKYDLSESEIAEKVGKNRSTITNKLRLIKLPPDLKTALRMKDPDFTEGHARAILPIRESKKIKFFFRRIKRDRLSVREIEKLVKNFRISTNDKNYRKIKKNQYISKYENSLIKYLGTKTIISKIKNKGSINIHFTDNEDLERIIELILYED